MAIQGTAVFDTSALTAMKFGSYIHVPHKINCNKFDDLLKICCPWQNTYKINDIPISFTLYLVLIGKVKMVNMVTIIPAEHVSIVTVSMLAC